VTVAENRVEIDERAVHELLTDWDGPVGLALEEIGEYGVRDIHIVAPRDTGATADSARFARDYDQAGEIEGHLGVKKYPADILHARAGVIWNRSPAFEPHTSGVRAAHPFLDRAAELLSTTRVWP
jgi:hypothetical protein